jgi:hypothetical protein
MAKIKVDCALSLTNEMLGSIVNTEALKMDPDQIAFPCGLLPRYFPSDQFTKIEDAKSKKLIPISTTGIWDGDLNYRFFHANLTYFNPNSTYFAPNNTIIQWMDIQDERFSNWMVRLQEKKLGQR